MPSRIRGWNSPLGTPVSSGHWLESSRSGGRFLSGDSSQKRFLFAGPPETYFLKQLGLETECECTLGLASVSKRAYHGLDYPFVSDSLKTLCC